MWRIRKRNIFQLSEKFQMIYGMRSGWYFHQKNQIKARVDSDGFSKATEIALARNIIKPEEMPMIKAKFYKRLAKSMRREMENELANELLNKAAQLEYESFVYFNK